jgi:hypothetical protein
LEAALTVLESRRKVDFEDWLERESGILGPFATRKDLVIMSDRDKGLDIAVEEMFPAATHSYCAQHIAANIQTEQVPHYSSSHF